MLNPETIEERQRVLQILEAHQAALAQAGLWPRIWDMVNNGVDFASESALPIEEQMTEFSHLNEEE
jgi:hypothetical protein